MPNRNHTIMITGASAGVGRAVVREIAGPHVHLGLIARGEDGLRGAQRDVESRGGRASVFSADVSDFKSVDLAASQLEMTAGPIDAWINVAMVSVFSPVAEMTPEEYRRVIEVTYLGYVHGTLAALRRMRPRDRGVIIQVGSALAYRSIPLQSAYCAAKHAVAGFTESLRTELLHEKSQIQVVQVHLPAMNTPQFSWSKTRLPNEPQPVPPIYAPEVAARSISWALRNPRREYWVGWPTVLAILGERIVPWFADRILAHQGYRAQQTDRPISPTRKSNLWKPVPGDHGAHGPFTDRERHGSIQALFSIARSKYAFSICVSILALTFFYFAGGIRRSRVQRHCKRNDPNFDSLIPH